MAGPEIHLELPWPPSVNAYWRSVMAGGRGRRCCRVLLSREGRAYRREACARLAAIRGDRPLTGRLDVRVELRAPTRRLLDIDNRIKALLDAMEHAGVYRGDAQVDRLLVERGPVARGGAALVTIREIMT